MKKNQLLALATAFLLWMAWPPIPYTAPILLIAFVPLLIGIENIVQSDIIRKGKQVFNICIIAFLIWNTACIYWVFNSLNAVMPVWVATLVSLIPFGLAALLMSFSFWLYYKLRQVINRSWSYVGLVCFWIGYEYLHQTWDLAFPWMNLGNGFSSFHQLIQWYEFTGVYGGTYWILVSNILVFETYLAYKKDEKNRRKWILLGRAIAHIAIPVIVSSIMYDRHQEKPNPANVVVVQPNIDPYQKFDPTYNSVHFQQLISLSDSIGQQNTEYFIWPETAISGYVNEEYFNREPNFYNIQRFLNKFKNANLITGIESYRLYDSPKTTSASFDERSKKYVDNFNAAAQVENSPKVQYYHKSKLVPGPEQLPFAWALAFLKPVFAGFGGSTGGYGKQKEPSVFYSQSGIGAAPVICYESIWGEYVSDYVLKGAQFIAIITNDAWWGNTSGKDQHLQYAKLRAIETRRWVARSANTGISGFINQRGDIVKQSNWWVATALKADINLNSDLTFYVKYGDFIAIAGSIGSGLFALLLLISKFRNRNLTKINTSQL